MFRCCGDTGRTNLCSKVSTHGRTDRTEYYSSPLRAKAAAGDQYSYPCSLECFSSIRIILKKTIVLISFWHDSKIKKTILKNLEFWNKFSISIHKVSKTKDGQTNWLLKHISLYKEAKNKYSTDSRGTETANKERKRYIAWIWQQATKVHIRSYTHTNVMACHLT